jgi:DUF2993 family protein
MRWPILATAGHGRESLRGCLSVLILAAAFVTGLVWFGGPPIAETIVKASLTSSGFEADDLEVAIRADPPLTLAIGRADEVAIEGRNVSWNDLRAESLSLTLADVDLLARTAGSATGFLDQVELIAEGGESTVGSVTFDGPAGAADATILVDAGTVQRLAFAAFEREFGSRPETVSLVGPNIVRVQTSVGSVEGRLEIDGGALAIQSSFGVVRLVEPSPSMPIDFTGVTVRNGGLELTGTIDFLGLLG